MDNTYFIFSNQIVEIERFHLCTWEFKNSSALVEIGCEISSDSIPANSSSCNVEFYIPWLRQQNSTADLFTRLKDSANSKFIFNDSVVNTTSFDGGRGVLGVIHEFQDRPPLCILPVALDFDYGKKKIEVIVDLSAYNNNTKNTNIYFRFSIVASLNLISIRKKGLGRSTLIYDQKVNEARNLPDHLFAELQSKQLCSIRSCFCFNIVPNSYDLSFLDSRSLKNVRTLEFDAFNRYLGDKRVQKDQLMVVFSKKNYGESFSFFSIFIKERIGAGQFAVAILINLISGILLFLPGYRMQNHFQIVSNEFWIQLPIEVYFAIFIGILLILYFIWPTLTLTTNSIRSLKIFKRKSK
jgi:hypothetical protein